VLQLVEHHIGLLETEIKLGDAALDTGSNISAIVGDGTDGHEGGDEKALELHYEWYK
jgi:hypothetical protein